MRLNTNDLAARRHRGDAYDTIPKSVFAVLAWRLVDRLGGQPRGHVRRGTGSPLRANHRRRTSATRRQSNSSRLMPALAPTWSQYLVANWPLLLAWNEARGLLTVWAAWASAIN